MADWQSILRAQYADGGCFANHSSYSEFLVNLKGKMTENEKHAIKCEQEGELLKLSKTGMAQFLDSVPKKPESGAPQ